MKKNVVVNSLSKEELIIFFSDATYGCNYWTIELKDKNAPIQGNCREDIWANYVLNDGILSITDNEDGKTYDIGYKNILKGFSKAYKCCPQTMNNFENENTDMWDGYNLMQCVLFGKVIYG